MKKKYIRNFSIIAHIDHGKSTLSDRIIEICTGIKINKKNSRILDSMEIEKERGITIKSQSVSLKYKLNNKKYKLNLIDTPGHIDFNNEVSRSLYICDGALLLIDATKGIQSQTITNYNIAKKLNIKIIPIINKIDILYNDIKNIKNQIKNILKIKKKKIIFCSSKKGIGIKNIIIKIINNIPYPKGNKNLPLQAIIIDSYFDNYLGIFLLIKIINGNIKKNDIIKIINFNKKNYRIKTIHIYIPKKKNINKLYCGEIGWISCNIKITKYFNPIGKIITNYKNKDLIKISKFKKIKPQVYASIYPENNKNFLYFKKSIEKLSLNDYSFTFKPENSYLLGNGFRCGFLGILHIEIIKERLEKEYNLNIIITSPMILYKIVTKKNKILYIENPNKLPLKNEIKEIHESISICKIITPQIYCGKIINLCINKRGKQKKILYYNNNNVYLKYEIPTYEIITNFSNIIKSISKGYASFQYKFKKYKKSNIELLEFLINNNKIEGFSILIYKKNIKKYSINIINIIKKNLQRQQFEIKIQSKCNNKIIFSSTIKSFRKNVISKCYGGDITRKKKLLKKQKKGKKKLKKIGNIIIPSKIYFEALKKKF